MTVNPLYQSGVIVGHGTLKDSTAALTTSTSLVTGLATMSMGLLCNTPLLIAPGMGYNLAIFVQNLQVDAQESWQSALGAVFIAGIFYILVILLIFYGVGNVFFFLFPASFRISIGTGIGVFLALLGLKTLTGIGMFTITASGLDFPHEFQYQYFLGFGGILLVGLLNQRKFRSSFVIAVLFVTALNLFIRGGKKETIIDPKSFGDSSITDIAGQLRFDFQGGSKTAAIIVVLIMHKLFDVMGTVLTVSVSTILEDHKFIFDETTFRNVMSKSVPLQRIFLLDAVWVLIGAVLGCSTTTVFIESVAAIAVGARTGLASVVAGLCFIASIGLYPIVSLVPPEATGVVLFLTSVKIFHQLKLIDYDNSNYVIPSSLTLLLITFTQNISLGISIGLSVGMVFWAISGDLRSIVNKEDNNIRPTVAVIVFIVVYGIAWINILGEMGVLY